MCRYTLLLMHYDGVIDYIGFSLFLVKIKIHANGFIPEKYLL